MDELVSNFVEKHVAPKDEIIQKCLKEKNLYPGIISPTRCGFTRKFIEYLYGNGEIKEIALESLHKPLEELCLYSFSIWFDAVNIGHEWCVLYHQEKYTMFESYICKRSLTRRDLNEKEFIEMVSKLENFLVTPSEDGWVELFDVDEQVFTKEDIDYYGWIVTGNGYHIDITTQGVRTDIGEVKNKIDFLYETPSNSIYKILFL